MLIAQIIVKLQQFVAIVSNPYRPELYYMRGPGPKWRAKHGQLVAQPALSAVRASRRQRPWA